MTKLTLSTVIEGITAISLNFSIEGNPQYQELIFRHLENKLTDEEFKQAVNKILSNEETFFNKMPPIATFLKVAERQELPLEQQAKIQVERIIEYAKGYPAGKVIFDNKTTNAVARDYGINYIRNQLTNEWLDYAKGESTIRRELLDKWLNYYHDKKEYCDSITISNYGNSVDMVGNKSICLQLLSRPKQIEKKSDTENQQKINLLMSNLVKKNE